VRIARRWSLLFGVAFSTTALHAVYAEKIVLGKIGAGSTVHWPIYIATEKGFFARRGIELDVITTPSNAAMQQQLAAGALDIGVSAGSPDPIRAVNQGAPAVILRVDSVVSPYALVTKASIRNVADLKGETISLDGTKGITRAYLDRIMVPSVPTLTLDTLGDRQMNACALILASAQHPGIRGTFC
jgi:ABC-type nitrate/sulfonate/bicarbonate transport system substrate-binding protein